MGEELAEREPVVSGKRPGLPRSGYVKGDGAGEDHEEGDEAEDVGAGEGGGVVEDPEDGVAGGVVQGGVEVGDAEEVGGEHDDAEGAVEDIAPEHGAGDCEGGVSDFFGYVGG